MTVIDQCELGEGWSLIHVMMNVDCVHLIYNFVHFIMNSGRGVLGCLQDAIKGLGGELWECCEDSV